MAAGCLLGGLRVAPLRRPDRIGPRQPLGVEAAGAMDRGELELICARVREAVRLTRRTHNDVPALHDQLLVADLERGLARLDEEHLSVWVAVSVWAPRPA